MAGGKVREGERVGGSGHFKQNLLPSCAKADAQAVGADLFVRGTSTSSRVTCDAGNASATVTGDTHYVSFYPGQAPDTGVFVSAVPVPLK